MNKFEVITDIPMSAHLETVQNMEQKYFFIRVRIDTPYGAVYFKPTYNSREHTILDIVNTQSNLKGE